MNNKIVDNVCVYGLEESIKASKYPMAVDTSECTDEITNTVVKLAQSKIGSGHDNFLNGIIVQFDLSFTLKAWTEMQRYHFVDFVSSQSTMHRITKFDLYNQCNKYVLPENIETLKHLVSEYNLCYNNKEYAIQNYIEDGWRGYKSYEELLKELYLKILYNIPTGFILTARMTMNYRQLKTIYKQRLNHRLPDWKEFCDFIEALPHSELITQN